MPRFRTLSPDEAYALQATPPSGPTIALPLPDPPRHPGWRRFVRSLALDTPYTLTFNPRLTWAERSRIRTSIRQTARNLHLSYRGLSQDPDVITLTRKPVDDPSTVPGRCG